MLIGPPLMAKTSLIVAPSVILQGNNKTLFESNEWFEKKQDFEIKSRLNKN